MIRRARQSGRSEWKRNTGLSLTALFLLAAGGCATGRQGVIAKLPGPVVGVHASVHRRVEVPRPIRRYTRPTKPQVQPSTADGWRPRIGISDRWTYIVVHHSGSDSGNAQRFDAYHRNVKGWEELGYHFVIGNGRGSGDGEIEVGPRWVKQKHGAHCKTPDNAYNDHGIGICLVGDFRQRSPSPAQMASLARLTKFLMRECNINTDKVLTHRGVTGRTACPGSRFPLHALRRSLARYSASAVIP